MQTSDIGIVPAAGMASRLPGLTGAKELLPVGHVNGANGCRPKAVSEYLFDALLTAGVRRVCIVVSPGKHDIVRFYGAGDGRGVRIAYVCQEVPTGMADAIDAAYPWIGDATVLMGMPDTIFRPVDALARLRTFFEREHAELALGIFPTDEPHRLGPVRFYGSGTVVQVLDKPDTCHIRNTWGIACWGVSFTEFLHNELPSISRSYAEPTLGLIFQMAIDRGLRVRALPFDDGLYIDVGTEEGLCAARRAVDGWSTSSR